MKQAIANRTENNLNNVSFQQKSTGLSLVITSSATLYFIARAWPMRATAVATDAIPAGYGGLVITTVILIIVAQIVLQTVLTIGQGNMESANVTDQSATRKASRNGYFVLTAAILAAIGSVFVEALTIFDTVTIAILGLALAEIVQAASRLIYARR
ncbi:MAG: hypothetical protein DHS20C20_30640 [Ardenticatenaceae bacterium]|nr:MAG: hypothetical protein DHS20C20_30640 [Ardenticatenaceae bacterium]